MNALTNENLRILGANVTTNGDYHATALAYVRTLITPYAEAIQPADLNGIAQWIPRVFPAKLMESATEKLTRFLIEVPSENAEEAPQIIYTNDPKLVTDAKEQIIQVVASELLQSARGETLDFNVLPWDVQRAVANDEDLSKMLGVGQTDTQLGVTVTVGPQQFTHMLTEELTMGLLLFSAPVAGNIDFHVTMFGEELEQNFILAERTYEIRYISTDERDASYSVEVANNTFQFNTTDFMQGFATGALWAGVDHHNYWGNLVNHTEDGQNIPITF